MTDYFNNRKNQYEELNWQQHTKSPKELFIKV